MKVVSSSAAEASLRRIGDYIARDNPARALSFVRELRGKALDLADMPRAFPLVPRFEKAGIRRRGHGRYVIFYIVERDRIKIATFAHSAQDYDRLLPPEPFG